MYITMILNNLVKSSSIFL